MNEAEFSTQSITWNKIGTFQDDRYIYRGHRCAEWHLETSLERASWRLYGSLEKTSEMESILLREFRRRLHHYTANVPGADEHLRWLSLMQHHGAPTRLLDWTYSIYVASYFALEYAVNNCAVWKIDKKWLNDEGESMFHNDSRTNGIFEPGTSEDIEKSFRSDVLSRKPIAAVVQIGPFQLDERLTIQKGAFLYPCHVSETFETNLKAMSGFNDPSHVLKLILPHEERQHALKMLDSMNISRATLFPGLDGFAQSLKVYHPLL